MVPRAGFVGHDRYRATLGQFEGRDISWRASHVHADRDPAIRHRAHLYGGIAFTDASGVFVAINTAPAPFGVGGFGLFGYATTGGVPLGDAFDNQHACEPGIWAPGPFAAAA